jgi:hypothetical protein
MHYSYLKSWAVFTAGGFYCTTDWVIVRCYLDWDWTA